ncbi:hypothetical protein [Rhodopseudomonas sp. BR0M22]|uniref:hypothetical protein n=1 Tax=Rhodopseudomonas sp. BR0M22 TaxID=2269369 RepID=UPI0013DF42A4|nr:hypothetical protein [Rhodopseudomonas sp. BR0M22]NEW90733.1 hypothetical protein [Rhodopseudomonas sp. BR0M22]
MEIPTPMCRTCGVDRELIEIEHANASFDVPHYRCPICNDVLRLAVRHADLTPNRGDNRH